MKIIEELNKFSEKRNAFEEEVRVAALETIGKGLQEFMQTHPDIDQIRWQQYTPYFADGDECIFSINEIFAHASSVESEDDEIADCDYGDGEGWSYGFDGLAEYGVSLQTISDLTELDDSLHAAETELKMAFGDHVEVIVTADGIDVEEYEHD